MGHEGSYLWQLRQDVGSRLLLVPGAQVIVLDDDRQALFQRRVDTGRWEFPGGAAEPGQDFRAAACTELAFRPLTAPPQPMSRSADRVLELHLEYVRTGDFQAF